MQDQHTTAEAQRNWRPKPWCFDAGIGLATLYALPPEKQPRSIKVGNVRLIIESPREWARRIGGAQ
jgi:hypothetical protein